MKNPKWHRDEIILALDLYFRPDRGPIDAKNPNIIQLSQELNLLPIFSDRPDQATFRNPNGVGLKLSNFLALDQEYHGKGMESYSKLDDELFNEFSKDKNRLRHIASQIRGLINTEEIRKKLIHVGDEDEMVDMAEEGEVLYRFHRYRERNGKLVKDKKKAVWNSTGALVCEVCDFDFYRVYGELGKNFIECHHTVPLSQYSVKSPTKMKDLALVCSNCHRMLHRRGASMSIDSLRLVVKVE